MKKHYNKRWLEQRWDKRTSLHGWHTSKKRGRKSMMKVVQGTFRQIPYWKLRGRFHSCGYRDQEVAKYIGIGRDTMSGRMQGHNPWTSAEITAMCELLDIRQNEIGELFFPSLEKGESA